jgi:hypothetical protein
VQPPGMVPPHVYTIRSDQIILPINDDDSAGLDKRKHTPTHSQIDADGDEVSPPRYLGDMDQSVLIDILIDDARALDIARHANSDIDRAGDETFLRPLSPQKPVQRNAKGLGDT